MSLVEGWLPPSRENWERIVWLWQFLPLLTSVQWLTDFWPAGKTSITSKYNVPGKWGWFFMELPGMSLVLYCMLTLPSSQYLNIPGGVYGLPWGNCTMAGLYIGHYIYRTILFPILNPSMSPMHISVVIAALVWQTLNGLSLGGWLAGYGPATEKEWEGRGSWVMCGMIIWGWAFMGNVFHDDELREIRREVLRRQAKKEDHKKTKDSASSASSSSEKKPQDKNKGAEKVYMMPKNGLFHYVLFPHYLCEFFEWGGYWMMGGLGCVPARSFLFNEMSSMIPRALAGWKWYVETFGREKVGSKKAIIPGIL